VSAKSLDDGEISYALVCLKTGALLGDSAASAPLARLEDLAAASPELFRAGRPEDLGALFGRFGSEHKGDVFREMVFVSTRAAYVVQRLPHQAQVALIAVSVDPSKLALMLSGVRARVLEQEARA
jgi:hypothetical protein